MDESQCLQIRDDWARTFDAVPDLIMVLDKRQRVVHANRAMAKRMNCEPEELVGKTCYQVVNDCHTPPMFCPHIRLMSGEDAHAVEVFDERLGSTFLVSVSPIRGPDGAITGSVHVARDITEQKQAEQVAVEAIRQRDQFLAMLSHELRNPLGAILSAASVVKRLSAHTDRFDNALAVIERQSQQMSALLDDLLDVSRVMRGKISLNNEDVDLVTVLGDALAAVRPLAAARNQSLAVAAVDAPLMVRGDPVRLQQIQVNLLMNAVKFTPPGGRIVVRLDGDEQNATFTVEDNGAGIARNMLDSVFELFVQADIAVYREQGGLGIGLTLVRKLVEMHGGRVWADSDGLGRGSRFTVSVPLRSSVMPAVAAVPSDSAQPVAREIFSRVLLIEDNADVRAMLQTLLTLEGHVVHEAADGPQGLETLTGGVFDIALIDIGLPGLDGYEVARRARAACGQRCPRLVALTGYGQPSDRAAVKAAGFDGHLVKPCDPEELLRLVDKAR